MTKLTKIMSEIRFYPCFYDMGIKFTTLLAYSPQLDPHGSLTVRSIFVYLLADNENNQLLVQQAVTYLIQTVIFHFIYFSEQLLALCAVYYWNNKVLLDIDNNKVK